VASIVEVHKDLSKKAKLLPIELKPSSTFDRKDPLLTAPVKNIVVFERELRSVVYLDFSHFNPLVVGTGTVSYTGGGNRYLPTEDGPKLQALNKAPWLESAKTLIEPAGGNLFSKYTLEEKCWEWTSSNGPVVSEGFYTMPGFDARIVNWIVNGVEGINNEWRVYFEEIDWSGETISGSAFLDVKPGSDTNCKFFIGLVAKDSSGALLFEKWEQVEPSSLSVHGVTWAKASSASASPGRIQIALKVVDFNRGDRFEVMAGLPQLEYSPSISSRSVGARVEDSLSFSSSSPFSPDYGRLTIEFAPNYSGVPGPCGPQLLLDTRDSTGRNGFWIGHRPDGLFEFGMADNLGSVYVRSASVIQIGDTKHTVVAWWDSVTKSMRIDLDGKTLVDKAMNTMTLPTTLNLYRIGTRYNGQHSGTFEIFTFKHEMTTE
jgi:hypothetical protein